MAKRTSPELPAGFRNNGLLELHYTWQEHLTQIYHGLVDGDRITDIRVKRREDGGWIAIGKGYANDGGPIVAFGSGYDALSALQGLEGAIEANKWREDKPWSPNGKK